MIDPEIKDKGSFRDPSGYVFYVNGLAYRNVHISYKPHYDHLIESGLYHKLVANKLLLPFEETVSLAAKNEKNDIYKTLKPTQIPIITYPYEWSFDQLKDAAILTLDIHLLSLEHGMILKDASAYNVQYLFCKPVFIDSLSFETYQPDTPWIAYKQFCEHFLGPLLISAKVDYRLGTLLKTHIDGIPLDLTSKLLPSSSYLNPLILAHIHLHAKSISRHEKQTSTKITDTKIPKNKHISLIKSLRHLISSINSNPSQTQWEDYESDNNYTTQARVSKERVVLKYLALTSNKHILDIGSNTGDFSRLAAMHSDHVISLDKDWNASNIRFSRFRQDSEVKNKITSFICDLIDPSPSIGWACEERKSIFERLSSDCALVLAVLHHLVISHNIPMEKVANLLSKITEKLIIEFVPSTDSQVLFLVKNIELDENQYSQEAFEKAFSKYFEIIDSTVLEESSRVIFYMSKRTN